MIKLRSIDTGAPARMPPALLLSLALALGGCAAPYTLPDPAARSPQPAQGSSSARDRDSATGFPGRDDRGSADAGVETGSGRGSADAPPAATSASMALLEQSRSERAAGSYTAAASSIERALRIDPGNALLWLELGEVKLADGDPQQAQMMARKALTLAGRDAEIAARAERLIDRAARCGSAGC
ncbi:MAG TPA: tetratricopeptide repeat protein [Gammaproteobacteria bacterium]